MPTRKKNKKIKIKKIIISFCVVSAIVWEWGGDISFFSLKNVTIY